MIRKIKPNKFSKKWFQHKLLIVRTMQTGYSKVLTATKGFKPNGQNKKMQRIRSLIDLAKEKQIKLEL